MRVETGEGLSSAELRSKHALPLSLGRLVSLKLEEISKGVFAETSNFVVLPVFAVVEILEFGSMK
jgi:hypothetical protein